MRWAKTIVPVLTRSQILFSTHRIFPVPTLLRHIDGNYCLNCDCCSTENGYLQKRFLYASNSEHVSQLRSLHTTTCSYAKGKDRGRDTKHTAKGKKKIEISDDQLGEVIKVDDMRTQMKKAVDRLKEDYVKNLSLRSTTGSIETVPVHLEGKEYELQELAQIVRKNPKTIVINMSAFPQAIPSALEAIQKSGMNLNPQQDGTTLFIPVPKVTKEHRENLAKNAKALFIKCRDSVRDVQNKFLRNVKSNKSISEDLAHVVQEQIIYLGDQYIAEGEKIYEAKHSELVGKD